MRPADFARAAFCPQMTQTHPSDAAMRRLYCNLRSYARGALSEFHLDHPRHPRKNVARPGESGEPGRFSRTALGSGLRGREDILFGIDHHR
jgi:hypothetical protein